ncbi:MAG: ECF transporter S component [Clostridiales bacterium]|nr:ECF transporter S component [Clostridiales bacterium]
MNKSQLRTRNLTYSALLIALGILTPQVFHMIGGQQAGGWFLPMHLPVLMAGLLLGPAYGAAVGAVTPPLSFLLSGMPPLVRLPFMLIELTVYGFASGLLRSRLLPKIIRSATPCLLFSLLAAQAAGRVMNAVSLLIAGDLLHLSSLGVAAAWSSLVSGLPGVVLQWLAVPLLVRAIEKGESFRHGMGNRQKKLR